MKVILKWDRRLDLESILIKVVLTRVTSSMVSSTAKVSSLTQNQRELSREPLKTTISSKVK